MSYRGSTIRIPLEQAGFQFSRDTEQSTPAALVEPSRNTDYHERGIGKRGGTSWYLGAKITNNPIIRGIYNLRKQSGNRFVVFSDSQGKLYHTNASNVLRTGMSATNFPSFATFDDKVFITDGASIPHYWDGNAATTSAVIEPTDWASTGRPFQFINHAQGANLRLWAVERRGVWASKSGVPSNFSDAESEFIQVFSNGGLVGGFDFGGVLFVWDRTQGYIIDDTNVDPIYWGYHQVQWEGGLAHFRLAVKAGNDLFLMTEDGLIYSISGVQQTGDYTSQVLTRPAFIDRFIREKVSKGSINDFHAVYDRNKRAIRWYLQVGGSNVNTALIYFIDRPPEVAWSIHDNQSSPSGFDAACSTEIQTATGNFEIWTGDWSGMIWKTDQSERTDNDEAYRAVLRIKRLTFEQSDQWKHFRDIGIRVKSQGNYDLTVRNWVDGRRLTDSEFSLTGSGAVFDEAIFDTSTFAVDEIKATTIEIGAYGYDIQTEIENSEPSQDFFATELSYHVKPLGTRITKET
jgi:hypothetical protein